ncbi:MAG TPA: hypothetical protein VGN72_20330 [Tepidisphaeraceae bacterium]|nr:hypothetical protein [Tepidisphaeraceae bacterium]
MRLGAGCFGYVLRRIVRRFLEIGINHLQVMALGDGPRVAEPSTQEVDRVIVGQFGLTG